MSRDRFHGNCNKASSGRDIAIAGVRACVNHGSWYVSGSNKRNFSIVFSVHGRFIELHATIIIISFSNFAVLIIFCTVARPVTEMTKEKAR